MSQPLTLFIIKRLYNYEGGATISKGLRTSAQFVVNMLLAEGHRAKLVEAVDGNSIDALVTHNAPARVVLEAIWVTPAKMAELQKRHPRIKWTVRVHSEIPFLANEGMAITWLHAYMKQGVEVAFNSAQTAEDFEVLGRTTYLPNYYPLRKPRKVRPESKTLDIGCFGAIRPLKNQLIQAFAAIRFAKMKCKTLRFHINGSRVEQLGSNNLKNMQALFADTDHRLVVHPWLSHEDFLELLATMDICMQVSLSESFNIVSADAVSMGVPLIGSDAIDWLPKRSQADVDSTVSICNALSLANETTVAMNHAALSHYVEHTQKTWNAWVAR